MSTWYRPCAYDMTIDMVSVVKETAKCLEIEGRCRTSRVLKDSGYARYFPTYGEARAYLVGNAEKDVKRAEVALPRARNRLAIVNKIPESPPEEA